MYDFSKQDPEIWNAMKEENERQEQVIELIASENIASSAVRAVQSSSLTNKYSVGYPGKRIYTGNEAIDKIDNVTRNRARKLFQAEYANVFPHSGTQANQAVYNAFLKPGDTILAMSEHAGGHFTHGQPHNFSGQLYDAHFYGVDPKTEMLNYNAIRKQALELNPKLIIAGASAYSHIIDWHKFREIADEVNAILMVDMAHIAGLIAGGVHPNPVPEADVVTSTTHKTLRGPRGGMILAKAKYADILDNGVFPASQSGSLEQIVAAKGIAYGEALQPSFKIYAKNVVKNAKAMGEIFKQSDKIRLVSGCVENHEMTLDLTKTGLTGEKAAELLYTVGIATNKELLPLENGTIMEGIRIGSPTITTRGFKEKGAQQVAKLIVNILEDPTNQTKQINAKKQVQKLTKTYPTEK